MPHSHYYSNLVFSPLFKYISVLIQCQAKYTWRCDMWFVLVMAFLWWMPCSCDMILMVELCAIFRQRSTFSPCIHGNDVWCRVCRYHWNCWKGNFIVWCLWWYRLSNNKETMQLLNIHGSLCQLQFVFYSVCCDDYDDFSEMWTKKPAEKDKESYVDFGFHHWCPTLQTPSCGPFIDKSMPFHLQRYGQTFKIGGLASLFHCDFGTECEDQSYHPF